MILITDTFKKLLLKIKSVDLEDIILEINKHHRWLDNLVEIWFLKDRKVLKWYLLSKKVRIVILYKEQNWNYLPFFIAKKETKDWFNITKNSLYYLDKKLDNIFQDLSNWKYEVIK